MKIKYRLISSPSTGEFEDELYNFTKNHPNYAIQYKPVEWGNTVLYTALISYEVEGEENNGI